MKNLLLTLLLLLPLHAEAQQMKAGPEYMPAEMEPITAPFDVCGISRPVFADRTATVKMNKRGLSTRHIQTAIDRMSRQPLCYRGASRYGCKALCYYSCGKCTSGLLFGVTVSR